jgi:hypothetical protein
MDTIEYAEATNEISVAVPPKEITSNGIKGEEHPAANLKGIKV